MFDYYLHAMQQSPKVFERMLRVMPPSALDDRRHPDRFTIREVICHLADSERDALDDLRQAVQKSGHEMRMPDLDQVALEHHYAERDPFHEAEVFASRRQTTVEFLSGLTPEDLDKVLCFGKQAIPLRDMPSLCMMHDLYHIEQISEFMANEAATPV